MWGAVIGDLAGSVYEFEQLKGIKSIIEIYGKASFWIMFLHFPILKIFDWYYINYGYSRSSSNRYEL